MIKLSVSHAKKCSEITRRFKTQKKLKLVKLFSKCAFRKIIYLYMYIDENNPNIFDDIFALLLHFNEYTSLIIFIDKEMICRKQK